MGTRTVDDIQDCYAARDWSVKDHLVAKDVATHQAQPLCM